jgi:Fur family ferric uptake transcriptional regulator
MALQPRTEPWEEPLDIVEPLCAVFRRKLKSEGLKYTPERAQVLECVLGQAGLFEAERVIDELKSARVRVSKATIYRTIKLLQDAGIIQRVLFDEDQAHYQVVYGRAPGDLVVRLDGGEAIAVDVPELAAIRERVCASLGLVAKGHRLHIFAVARDGPGGAGSTSTGREGGAGRRR